MFSAGSLGEGAIKSALGSADFQVDARLLRCGLLDNGYQELVMTSLPAVTISSLPAIHRGLFDRLLIAQSMAEGITLLTGDPVVAQYPGPIQQV